MDLPVQVRLITAFEFTARLLIHSNSYYDAILILLLRISIVQAYILPHFSRGITRNGFARPNQNYFGGVCSTPLLSSFFLPSVFLLPLPFREATPLTPAGFGAQAGRKCILLAANVVLFLLNKIFNMKKIYFC